MTTTVDLYVTLDKNYEEFLSHLVSEQIRHEEIIPGIYLLKSVTEDQRILMHLRFGITSTYITTRV